MDDHLIMEPASKFDAYVAYDDKDLNWVVDELLPIVEGQFGLTLYIWEKYALGGIPISENIVDAIDRCRKTILVITPAFVNNEWREFEMQMGLGKGHKDLVIIYKEEVEVKNMSRTLRSLMANFDPLDYENTVKRHFWDKLKDRLKRTDD